MKSLPFKRTSAIVLITFLSFLLYISYLYSIYSGYPSTYGVPVKIVLTCLSASLFVLFYWSFLKCTLAGPGYVDHSWALNAEENNIEIEKNSRRCYTPNKYTVCEKCDFLIRPERAHHCRSCNKCVLKMDHHCPSIGVCVGENNLKFFFLFLCYALLICTFVAASVMPKFIQALLGRDRIEFTQIDHASLVLIICTVLSLVIALLVMVSQYIYFISHNITVIESTYNGTNPYDMGVRSNWKMVFGEFSWKWFLPLDVDNPYQHIHHLYPLNEKYIKEINLDLNDTVIEVAPRE